MMLARQNSAAPGMPWRLRALLSVALGSLLLAGFAGTAARAGDDDDDQEDPGIEQKIFKSVLSGLGVQTDPGIDYRERSPLVVPPKLDLPPPETTASIEKRNPAWPVDADVKRRKDLSEARRSRKGTAAEEMEADAKPLRPDQVNGNAPRSAPGSSSQGPTYPDLDTSGKPMSQQALGSTGIFGGSSLKSMFGFGSASEEYTTFTKEPERSSLVEPPPGYRTPSAAQPYGVGSKKNEQKAADPILDHGMVLR
jgi:hypothetical protein